MARLSKPRQPEKFWFWHFLWLLGIENENHVGRYEIVGTLVKDPEQLPTDLLADEKHVHFNGEKGYIATTVGASLALAADEAALTQAYGRFNDETRQVKPDYQPQTVNTDGWFATQNAWRALFASIVVIQCFLHAFLKIRERGASRPFTATFSNRSGTPNRPRTVRRSSA